MQPFFVDCPPSNVGALLVVMTTVVGPRGFGESLWVGEDFKLLIRSMIYANIALIYYVSFIIPSSESCLLAFISCLLASIAACMMMKFSSVLLSILLLHFGTLKLGV